MLIGDLTIIELEIARFQREDFSKAFDVHRTFLNFDDVYVVSDQVEHRCSTLLAATVKTISHLMCKLLVDNHHYRDAEPIIESITGNGQLQDAGYGLLHDKVNLMVMHTLAEAAIRGKIKGQTGDRFSSEGSSI